jgi:hypothetical protein
MSDERPLTDEERAHIIERVDPANSPPYFPRVRLEALRHLLASDAHHAADAARWREEASRLRAVLNVLASWGEGNEVTSSFDEPHAAKMARRALAGEPGAEGGTT